MSGYRRVAIGLNWATAVEFFDFMGSEVWALATIIIIIVDG
jgi:hypothetical protein